MISTASQTVEHTVKTAKAGAEITTGAADVGGLKALSVCIIVVASGTGVDIFKGGFVFCV